MARTTKTVSLSLSPEMMAQVDALTQEEADRGRFLRSSERANDARTRMPTVVDEGMAFASCGRG